MKTNLILLILFSAGTAWGVTKAPSLESVQRHGDEFVIRYGTFTTTPMVVLGNKSYTLSEFVSSGEFCKWRGYHDYEAPSPCEEVDGWLVTYIGESCPLRKCRFCGKKQRKKTEWQDDSWMEWEFLRP